MSKVLLAFGSTTKIINLDEENSDLICKDLPTNLDETLTKRTGQLFMQRTPIICGSCRCQIFQNSSWSYTPKQKECTDFAASAVLTNSKGKEVFFMTGGSVSGNSSDIVDTFDGTLWQRAENLPQPVSHHCIVTINSTTIYSMGGDTGSDYVRNTYFYNAQVNKWTPGPSLIKQRSGLSCGILKWRNPESKKLENVVVAAGGMELEKRPFVRKSFAVSSVEILYLNDDNTNNGEWKVGPELPKPAAYATLNEYNSSLFLIGGFDDIAVGNHMYRLSSPDGPWVHMNQTLKNGIALHASFLVPDEIVTCD